MKQNIILCKVIHILFQNNFVNQIIKNFLLQEQIKLTKINLIENKIENTTSNENK